MDDNENYVEVAISEYVSSYDEDTLKIIRKDLENSEWKEHIIVKEKFGGETDYWKKSKSDNYWYRLSGDGGNKTVILEKVLFTPGHLNNLSWLY